MLVKEEKNILPDLYFNNKGKWSPFQSWANFFVNLGFVFYGNLPKSSKARLVITVPTRSFVGVLFAYGAMLSSISNNINKNIIIDNFNKLKKIKGGTSVIYRDDNRTYRGKFSGIEIINGEERISISVQAKRAGNLTFNLNPKQALSVQVVPDKNYKLPKNPQGKKNTISKFLKDGLDGYNYNLLLTLSKPQFYFISRKKLVEEEVIDNDIAIYNVDNKKHIKGSLQEVLRIKELSGEQDSYQSRLLSTSAKKHTFDFTQNIESTFAIFDGAISYLRWREDFIQTHSLIILDRTEAQFENALYELDDEYILSNKLSNEFPFDDNDIPNGIELMYWEADQ